MASMAELKPDEQSTAVMTPEAMAAYEALPDFWRLRLVPLDFCFGYYFGKRK